MAAQAVAVSGGYAPALVWRGLLLLRAVGIGLLAGMAAGFIAGGVGSRLAMKIVAIVAGPGARGRITENGNAIGAFTADTIFLLFFGAALGTIGGMLYLALQPWLASAGRWRGLAFGAVLLVTIRAGTIDSKNFDFTRFGVPALNVALFAALPLAFGCLVAPWADWLDRRVAMPARDSVGGLGVPGGVALVTLAAAPTAFLVLLSVGIGMMPLQIPLGGLALVVVGYAALGTRLFPAGAAWRLLRLGGYLIATSAGVLGCVVCLLLFSGLVLNGEERGATRLSAAMLFALLAGGLAGRFWPVRDGGPGMRRPMALLLAVPVLVGLVVTSREIGLIVFGS